MIDRDALLYAPVFERLGIPARYLPVSGDPVDCKVLDDRGEVRDKAFARAGFQLGSSAQPDSRVLRVRVAEVASPNVGERIEIVDGQTYPIARKPELEDNRCVWRLEMGRPS